jgi:hypothetical protein
MGLRLATSFNTAELPPEEAVYWHEMVEVTHFFELPEDLTSETGQDRLLYLLTVITVEQQHTVRTSDEAAPESLLPFLRRLTLIARFRSIPGEQDA